MSDIFLTPAELHELTGFKDRHCQARWLTRNRWRYVVDRHNRPRVARNHFAERMGCGTRPGAGHVEAIHAAAIGAQPNYAALTRR